MKSKLCLFTIALLLSNISAYIQFESKTPFSNKNRNNKSFTENFSNRLLASESKAHSPLMTVILSLSFIFGSIYQIYFVFTIMKQVANHKKSLNNINLKAYSQEDIENILKNDGKSLNMNFLASIDKQNCFLEWIEEDLSSFGMQNQSDNMSYANENVKEQIVNYRQNNETTKNCSDEKVPCPINAQNLNTTTKKAVLFLYDFKLLENNIKESELAVNKISFSGHGIDSNEKRYLCLFGNIKSDHSITFKKYYPSNNSNKSGEYFEKKIHEDMIEDDNYFQIQAMMYIAKNSLNLVILSSKNALNYRLNCESQKRIKKTGKKKAEFNKKDTVFIQKINCNYITGFYYNSKKLIFNYFNGYIDEGMCGDHLAQCRIIDSDNWVERSMLLGNFKVENAEPGDLFTKNIVSMTIGTLHEVEQVEYFSDKRRYFVGDAKVEIPLWVYIIIPINPCLAFYKFGKLKQEQTRKSDINRLFKKRISLTKNPSPIPINNTSKLQEYFIDPSLSKGQSGEIEFMADPNLSEKNNDIHKNNLIHTTSQKTPITNTKNWINRHNNLSSTNDNKIIRDSFESFYSPKEEGTQTKAVLNKFFDATKHNIKNRLTKTVQYDNNFSAIKNSPSTNTSSINKSISINKGDNKPNYEKSNFQIYMNVAKKVNETSDKSIKSKQEFDKVEIKISEIIFKIKYFRALSIKFIFLYQNENYFNKVRYHQYQ